MKHKHLILFVCVIVFLNCPMLAHSPDSVFNSGNELYRAGKYQ